MRRISHLDSLPLARLGVLLAVLATTPANAQRVVTPTPAMQVPDESELAARLTALDREHRTLRTDWRARFDSADARRTWETRRVAGGTLRASSPIAARASEAAELAWTRVERRGGSALRAVRDDVVLIVRDDSARWSGSRPTRSATVRFGSGDARDLRRSGESVSWPWTAERLADVMVRHHEQLVTALADESLDHWRMQQRVPLAPASPDEWRRVARERALVSSRALRGCAAGEAGACAAALGLGPDARPDAWYSDEDIRSLLERVLPARRDSSVLAARQQCVSRNDRAACRTALAAFAPGEIPPPVAAGARRLLLDVALELGGEGALERLLAPEGSLDERIARAARAPIDSVVLAWRERLDRAAPAPTRLAPSVAIASVGWSAFFILLAGRRRRVA